MNSIKGNNCPNKQIIIKIFKKGLNIILWRHRGRTACGKGCLQNSPCQTQTAAYGSLHKSIQLNNVIRLVCALKPHQPLCALKLHLGVQKSFKTNNRCKKPCCIYSQYACSPPSRYTEPPQLPGWVLVSIFYRKYYPWIKRKVKEVLTQEELRTMLHQRLEREKASYICKVIGMNKDTLSKFKNNKIDLYPHLFVKLQDYLLNN